MPAFNDITGQRFGRLMAIRPIREHGRCRWLCRCECGNETVVTNSAILINGHTRSCGCLRDGNPKHGGARRSGLTREYKAWKYMWRRCTNPRSQNFKYYGGRGIKVCEQWKSFETFLADMGSCPDGYSIERIDNDGNYEPSNCKWIPLSEQPKNRRPEAYGHRGKYK